MVDCRAGLPGRLIPILHNLRGQDVPIELPHTVYVGHWEGQERVFRDMRACQDLNVRYGQEKVAVSNRPQERKPSKSRGKTRLGSRLCARRAGKPQSPSNRNSSWFGRNGWPPRARFRGFACRREGIGW